MITKTFKPFIFQCLSTFPMALAALIFALSTAVNTQAEYHPIKRLSVSSSSIAGNMSSSSPQISGESTGRYVVFSSLADNLVTGDTNGFRDIFLHDLVNKKTLRISTGTGTAQTNNNSYKPTISNDGRYIVYESDASNIVTGDSNSARDIFRYDTQAKSTIRVSLSTGEIQGNASSKNAAISGDGLFIVYESDASNLVAGDSNASSDIFLYDVAGESTSRVSLKSGGSQATGDSNNPKISDNGQYIVFESDAANLIASDTNLVSDVFLHDTGGPTTVRASVSSSALQLTNASNNPNISADGSVVAFESAAENAVVGDNNNLVDIFTYLKADGSVARISVSSGEIEANGASSLPSLSDDGRYISFISSADNLVKIDNNEAADIFVHDRVEGDTFLVSVNSLGRQGSSSSGSPSINSSGQFIAFTSNADDLITGDTNDAQDVFRINTQCLVEPVGVTPGDFDADGTDDCKDGCPSDSAKVSAGTCGCGTADTDTDSDGTPDCNDGCPGDPSKTEAGSCGCGMSDADNNGNETADCLDPTTSTVPARPRVSIRKGGIVRVIVGSDYPNQRAQVQLRAKKRTLAAKKTRKRSAQFKNVTRKKGRARFRYIIPGTSPVEFSSWSKGRRYRIK